MEQLSFDDLEKWLPVVGYEGLYAVSDLGRVRSFHKRRAGRLMKISTNKVSGYATVALSRSGSAKHWTVHTLVLEAFDRPRPEGMECRHRNGDRADPALTNLEWGTSGENNLDQVEHGTHNNARKDRCKKDHEYTPENTIIKLRADGTFKQRVCRICYVEWRQESTARVLARDSRCVTDGCARRVLAKGLCGRCYQRQWRQDREGRSVA